MRNADANENVIYYVTAFGICRLTYKCAVCIVFGTDNVGGAIKVGQPLSQPSASQQLIRKVYAPRVSYLF